VDAADVHVLDAVLDPVAAGAHLLVAGGLDPEVLLAAPSDAHEPHLEVGLALELPDLVTLLGLDDAGGLALEPAGQASFEGVGWLEHVVVHGDQGVPDVPRFRVGQKSVGDGSLDAQLDDTNHRVALPGGVGLPRFRVRPSA
jgi:hypothetical protein